MTASAMPSLVVSGLGLVSPLGWDAEAIWSALADRGPPEPSALGIPEIDALPIHRGYYLTLEERARCAGGPGPARASDYAVMAARAALAEAGIEPGATVGVVMGSGMGDAEAWRVARRDDPSRDDVIFRTAERVGAALDLDGPTLEIAAACAAGGYAIATAAMLLRSGEADLVLCGGADAPSFHALAAFNRLGALDPERCRPFDVRRAGTMFGEGAAVLALERADAFARRGGARAYARLEGVGMSCDAEHPTAPAQDGVQVERAARAALAEAGIGPDACGAVLPHATGTQLNDRQESAALARIFGAEQPWSLPLKAFAGHGGGMSGALSTLVAALVLARDAMPAAAPIEADPDCPVRLAPTLVENAALGHALVSAYAFGGANISLVLRGTGGHS